MKKEPELLILLSIRPKSSRVRSYDTIAKILNDRGTDSYNKGESKYINQKKMVLWRKTWKCNGWNFDSLNLLLCEYLKINEVRIKKLKNYELQVSFVAYGVGHRLPGLNIAVENIYYMNKIGASIDVDWYA